MAYVYANLIKKGAINPKTGKPYTCLLYTSPSPRD